MKLNGTEDFEDGIRYDNIMPALFLGYEEFSLVSLSVLSSLLGDEAHILDVGCGTGKSLITYATHKLGWSLTGVDPTESKLQFAQKKVNDNGFQDRVRLLFGYAHELPEDELYDAATLILIEHLLPDDGTKLLLLKSISQRLKAGAPFILAGLYGDFETTEVQQSMLAWQNHLIFKGYPARINDFLYQKTTEEDSLISEVRIRELLTEAGFDHIHPFYKAHLFGGWLAQKG